MSATGNEVVTLKQLKMAMDSAGGGISLKTITRDDNADNLRDISDAGVYYRSGGGTIRGVPAGLQSAPFVLEVLPIWHTGSYWVMMQRCTGIAGITYVRTIDTNNTWTIWQLLSLDYT